MRKKINLNQLSLPFREGRSSVFLYEHQMRVFWFMVSVCLFSLLSYVYAIYATSHNIAVLENLETKVLEIEGKLGSLEFAYIALKNNISMELAHSYGFKEVKNPLYVYRGTNGSTLTLNTVTR